MNSVAKTYQGWESVGEPFLRDDKYFIKLLVPNTRRTKVVRWYGDPRSLQPREFLGKLFGFESPEDSIYCIKKRYLTAEDENYFRVTEPWRSGQFYGGCWYAPQESFELPPIKNWNKIFLASWEEFKTEGKKNSQKLGLVGEEHSVWFKEDIYEM